MARPFGLLLILTLVAGCGGPPAPIPSPDGTMILLTRIEKGGPDPSARNCVVFEVRDSAGKTLHAENTRASNDSRWRVDWESNDAIRLQSSDIGGWTWRRQADGTWKKVLPPGHFDPDSPEPAPSGPPGGPPPSTPHP